MTIFSWEDITSGTFAKKLRECGFCASAVATGGFEIESSEFDRAADYGINVALVEPDALPETSLGSGQISYACFIKPFVV